MIILFVTTKIYLKNNIKYDSKHGKVFIKNKLFEEVFANVRIIFQTVFKILQIFGKLSRNIRPTKLWKLVSTKKESIPKQIIANNFYTYRVKSR